MSDERQTDRYWRYQPVIMEFDDPLHKEPERIITFAECHFEDGALSGWSTPLSTESGDQGVLTMPFGDDANDLFGALARMMVALRRWEPVPFTELRPGMKFVPRVTDPTDDLITLRTMFLTIPNR